MAKVTISFRDGQAHIEGQGMVGNVCEGVVAKVLSQAGMEQQDSEKKPEFYNTESSTVSETG